MRHVVASAAEAETAGLFFNAQEALPIRYLLEQLGHKQPPTPLKTDNSTANSFVHSNIRQKRSKSWDMRFHWLRDKEALEQLNIYWEPGKQNDADYFTKHHSPQHHLDNRKKFVHIPKANCIIRNMLSSQRRAEGVLIPCGVQASFPPLTMMTSVTSSHSGRLQMTS